MHLLDELSVLLGTIRARCTVDVNHLLSADYNVLGLSINSLQHLLNTRYDSMLLNMKLFLTGTRQDSWCSFP